MIEHTTNKTRTENRNQVFLITYTEYVYRRLLNNHNYSMTEINDIVNGFGSAEEVSKFFDRFTLAFGKWLLERTPRTLEHPMEELLSEFREYLSYAPDSAQVDNY